jgi:hypothetical protein
LEKFQNFQAWYRCLKAGIFQAVDGGHVSFLLLNIKGTKPIVTMFPS